MLAGIQKWEGRPDMLETQVKAWEIDQIWVGNQDQRRNWDLSH